MTLLTLGRCGSLPWRWLCWLILTGTGIQIFVMTLTTQGRCGSLPWWWLCWLILTCTGIQIFLMTLTTQGRCGSLPWWRVIFVVMVYNSIRAWLWQLCLLTSLVTKNGLLLLFYCFAICFFCDHRYKVCFYVKIMQCWEEREVFH